MTRTYLFKRNENESDRHLLRYDDITGFDYKGINIGTTPLDLILHLTPLLPLRVSPSMHSTPRLSSFLARFSKNRVEEHALSS